MKSKVFIIAPIALVALYPIFAFEVSDYIILGHDLFDYSMPIFFATLIFAIISLFIVKGKLKLIPIFSIVAILVMGWFSMMLSMS